MWGWESPSLRFKPRRHSFGGPGPWSGHLAFGYDLVAVERPKLLVELGTFYGESYFSFCQAVEENSIGCACYAVDTWQGDAHGGFYGEDIYSDVEAYNREHYSSYSHLLRMTFDEALSYFSDESIDILHLDGHHSYESVRNDFESWIGKVCPGGILLLHDICIRKAGFGVWRFWQELCESFPHFAFGHGAGLGVVVKPGPEALSPFLCGLLSADRDEQVRIGRYYATLAGRFQLEFDVAQLRKKVSNPLYCSAQVFYSLDQGFTEQQSSVHVVGVGNKQRITFELPEGIPAKPLRIDPADRVCIIEISEISISAADRSAVIWKWNGDGPSPRIQVGGTARLLTGHSGITIVSEGIDPQLILPDIGGEPFQRPLELDLVLRITPCLQFNDRTVPLGNLDEAGVSQELDRAFLRDEVRVMLTELTQCFKARDDFNPSNLAEVSRKVDDVANLVTKESSRMVAEYDKLLLGAIVEVNRFVKNEADMIRKLGAVANAEIVELRKSLEAERTRSQDFEQSWSWRVTAPARIVLGWFRDNHIR